MIGRTNTGGSIMLHIIGSNTKPSVAGENTIWLNTEVTIPNWCFQKTAPEDPAVGDVYITTRYATENVLDISSPNSVKIYLGTARQWQNVDGEDKWIELTGEVFYDGAWHDIETFVYDGSLGQTEGNYNSQIGGASTEWERTGGTVTNANNRFAYSITNGGGTYSSGKAIDLTEVSAVQVIFTSSYGSFGNYRFALSTGRTSTPAAASPTYERSYSSKTTVSIDTSGLEGLYYFSVRINNNNGTTSTTIYEIKLIS